MSKAIQKFSTVDFVKKKRRGEKISMITCYDASFARIVDASAVDAILVGDSLGNVIQGHPNTLPVTLEEVIYHTRAVMRGVARVHVVADLPFLSYQVSHTEGLRSAGRLIKEGGAEAVKLEGGERVVELVHDLVAMGVPVMGHLGLTPQSVHVFGGHKVQAREKAAAERLLQDALLLQEAGAYSLVLEGIPAALATRVSKELTIPTIGIGAGPGCDGQVLVLYDLLGMDQRFNPKFLKKYRDLSTDVRAALDEYAAEVGAGSFPGPEHSF
jgi:3-methyl-2-oxobutanoate hydroxymethyltransferase